MNRGSFLKSTPLLLAAGCGGVVPAASRLILPQHKMRSAGSGSGSGCSFDLQHGPWGIRLYFTGCNNGRSGNLQILYWHNQWDDKCTFTFEGSPPQQHDIVLGNPPDPKWAKRQIFKLFHKYFQPNGTNGGTLCEYDGTPLVDTQFHVDRKRYVTTNFMLSPSAQYEGSWGSDMGPLDASQCTADKLAYSAAVIAEAIACLAPGIGWLEIVPLGFAVAATGIQMKNDCR